MTVTAERVWRDMGMEVDLPKPHVTYAATCPDAGCGVDAEWRQWLELYTTKDAEGRQHRHDLIEVECPVCGVFGW